jgi:hypothetical protein
MPNKLLSPELLQSALDLIEKGVTRPTKIAAGIGVAYRTYCNFMVRSNNNDPEFVVNYNGVEMQWAKAITLATRLAGLELRGMLLQESVFGYDEIQTSDGQVVWALDPAACALSEDEREDFGFRRDGLLIENGRLVPVTIRRKAPFAQSIRLLESMFADLRPTQTINSNVNVKGMLGVGVARPVDYYATIVVPPAPPIPLAPPQADVTDASFTEIGDDDPELADMIDGPPEENLVERAVPTNQPQGPGPGPVSVAINIVLPEPEPVPDVPVPPVPPPMGIADAPRRAPRTQLEADLFAKLDAARTKPTQDGANV